jgi:hypothetical protein
LGHPRRRIAKKCNSQGNTFVAPLEAEKVLAGLSTKEILVNLMPITRMLILEKALPCGYGFESSQNGSEGLICVTTASVPMEPVLTQVSLAAAAKQAA